MYKYSEEKSNKMTSWKLINQGDEYAILADDILHPLSWVSISDMNDFYIATETKGIPSYYSNDGRFYPIPEQKIDRSELFNGKPWVIKPEKNDADMANNI